MATRMNKLILDLLFAADFVSVRLNCILRPSFSSFFLSQYLGSKENFLFFGNCRSNTLFFPFSFRLSERKYNQVGQKNQGKTPRVSPQHFFIALIHYLKYIVNIIIPNKSKRYLMRSDKKIFCNKFKGDALTEKTFTQLVNIMEKLRSPEGCPWDKEQTHDSLRPYLLEECYEVLETLDEKDYHGLKEELGDLLLQVVYHAQLAKEEDLFTITDVLETINQKLVRRHPHVFGRMVINTSEEQRVHWERLKKKEGKTSVLDGVPKALSSLLRAHRIQQKASTVGFDWEKIDQVWDKVNEERAELEEAIESQNQASIEEELGDFLFALVNLSRFIKVNPEDALRSATEKFISRFKKVESTMEALGLDLKDATLEEMDAVWERIK